VDRSFQSDVQRASRRKFARTRGDSWEDKIYKQCGRDAVDRELDNVGNDCLTDPIAGRDCNTFGKEVARLIVRQAGVCDKYGYRVDSIEQFQRACISVATNTCEGFIRDAAEEPSCGGRISNVGEENNLASKCRSKVWEFTY